jgi:hypothetical protein
MRSLIDARRLTRLLHQVMRHLLVYAGGTQQQGVFMEQQIFSQIVARFERDMKDETFSFLGQAALGGSLHALVGRDELVRFLDVLPGTEIVGHVKGEIAKGKNADEALDSVPAPSPQKWFPAEEGWKAVTRIKEAMRNPANVKKAGLESVLAEVGGEVDRLLAYLRNASDDNIRFRLELQECLNPPDAQVQWIQRENAEFADMLTKMATDLGCDLNEAQAAFD